MTSHLKNVLKEGRGQRGAAAVEFALIAMLFFSILLGIIEFGRFFYVWNTVQEVTRKAAREAVVRDFSSAQIDAVQREAIFRFGSSGNTNLFFSPEVTNLSVNIQYLDVNKTVISLMPVDPVDNISACLDITRVNSCIRYVEVKVCAQNANNCDPVQYIPLMGLFPFLALDIPLSTVTMPAESLGFAI